MASCAMASDNSKLKTQNLKLNPAFTLVELMIVVAILGILAAVAFPEFQGHIQKAKEAAAKDNLRILREAIERYANDHNGVPPGYFANNPILVPTGGNIKIQLVSSSTKYLMALPKNPFNNLATLLVIGNATDFPAAPSQTTVYGWIYKPATKTVKLNWAGTDSEEKEYFSY